MSAIHVHLDYSGADARSLSAALERARAGDVVLVGPGVYSPARTGEVLPLRVPDGVLVEGSGTERCTIDGEGQFEPSFGPIRPELAVVVLGDGAGLSGVEVTNGGGHGIGVPTGGSATVRYCAITRNGDHGIYLCGMDQALIVGCVFADNGLKRFQPTVPRGTGSPRQGHQVFAEARHGQRNRLVVADNTMRGCFADGVAFVCFHPEPDGVEFEATIVRNAIEGSERGGLLFACSFGPSGNRQRIVAAGNVLRGNHQYGIQAVGAATHADPVPRGNRLEALFSGNEIVGSPVGIFVRGAAGDSHENVAEVVIDRNTISGCEQNAIRLAGAIGVAGVRTSGNALRAVVSRNVLSGGERAVAAQGAARVAGSEPRDNVVELRLLRNQAEGAFVASDGVAENRVEVDTTSQPVARTDEDLLG